MSARRQARADAALARSEAPTEVPAEFLIGRCIEVWAADEKDALSAHSRFGHARKDYAARAEASIRDVFGSRAPGAPYSVDYLLAQDRAEPAAQRFAAAGVTFKDIPALRRAAHARVKTIKLPNGDPL